MLHRHPTLPPQPKLKPAPSIEELRRRQSFMRALCGFPAMLIVGIVVVIGLAFFKTVRDFRAGMPNVDGDTIAVVMTMALGIAATYCLVKALLRGWLQHSPLQGDELNALTKIIGEEHVRSHGIDAQENLTRYHNEVLAMDREFTRFDLAIMKTYCADMDAWRARMKRHRSEQALRAILYGDQLKAARLTQSAITRAGRR